MFDAARFAWLQSLVDRVSRRQALAGALGMAALALNEDVDAKKNKKKRKSKKKKKVKGCPGKQVKCDDQCRDLSSDIEHCGACWESCYEGQICSAGVCTVPCSEHACLRSEFPGDFGGYRIVTMPDGNLAALGGDSQIGIYDQAGNLIRTIGEFGTEPGEFNDPSDLAVASDGTIFVVDYDNERIQILRTNGTTEVVANDSARRIAVAPSGLVYVGSYSYVSRTTETLTPSYSWGPDGTDSTSFEYLAGLAVDSTGNVYVLDREAGKVYRFHDDGSGVVELLWGIGGIGLDPSEFRDPEGLTVTEGRVYIADANNNRIQVLNAVDGAFLFSFPVTELDGYKVYPYAVAVGSGSTTFVADGDIFVYGLTS